MTVEESEGISSEVYTLVSKMGKTISIIFIFLLLLGGMTMIVGCSGKQPTSGDKIVLRYTGAASPAYDRYRAEQGKGFEKSHPNLIVKYEPVSVGGYVSKVLSQISAGVSPDVIAIYGPMKFVEFARRDVLIDLTPYIMEDKSQEEILQSIYPRLLSECIYEGKQYALPGNLNVDVLYYNKKLFDETGVSYPNGTWTWDTLLSAAKRLTKSNKRGNISQFGLTIDCYPYYYRVFMKQNGAGLWTEDKTRCIINSPESKEVFSFLKDLIVKYHVTPNYSEEQGEFGGGRSAMMPAGLWWMAVLSEIKDLDWNIAPLPRGKMKAIPMGGMSWAVIKGTKHPKMAYELIKHITSPEGVRFLIGLGDSMPIRGIPEETEYFITHPKKAGVNNQIFIDAMEYGYSDLDFAHPKVPYEEMENLIRLEWDRFILSGQSVEETLGNIESILNKIITIQ